MHRCGIWIRRTPNQIVCLCFWFPTWTDESLERTIKIESKLFQAEVTKVVSQRKKIIQIFADNKVLLVSRLRNCANDWTSIMHAIVLD